MQTRTEAPRRLHGLMLLPPEAFLEATSTLQTREVGALALIATWWWSEGQLPEGTDLGACLGIRRSRAEAMMPALRPFFEPSGFFGLMRSAALAKSARRARAGRKGAAALHRTKPKSKS